MASLSQTIITIGAVITACITIFGVAHSFAKYIALSHRKAILQQENNAKRDSDISRLKEENALICYGLSACLDGLEQLGANHSVPIAKQKLEKYINQQAHRQ